MKKITILLISLMLLCNCISAQTTKYAIRFPDDNTIIDSILNKYSACNYKLLVYQTGYGDDCMSSIVLIKTNETVKYWCLMYKDHNTELPYSIIVSEGNCITNDYIFSFTEYTKAGITQEEDTSNEHDFPTPSRESEIIFYKDNNVSFYFEDNTNTGFGYLPDLSREKYRKEWTKIIRNEIKPLFELFCTK